MGPFLGFPGPFTDCVSLAQGRQTALPKPAGLDRGSHANKVEGIGPAGWIGAQPGLQAAVCAGCTIGSGMVDHGVGHTGSSQGPGSHADVFADAEHLKGMADKIDPEGPLDKGGDGNRWCPTAGWPPVAGWALGQRSWGAVNQPSAL